MPVDENKLQAFMGRAVGDMSSAAGAVMVLVGDRLGLYKALAQGGPMTPEELAKKTGTAERYVREWLNSQAAGGYMDYDAKNRKYSLPPEQAMALADEASPFFIPGGFLVISAMFQKMTRIIDNFKTGKGLDWGEHHEHLFEGTERFFRANYIGNLLSSWIPALDGMEKKLNAGATVADVGCGLGASTILMAKAFPKSKFFGFDYHLPSIETARERAREAGVGDRITFETAKSTDYPGKDYDLVCFFDCLHDMSDPVGVSRHVLRTLKKNGAWMIVEPFAGDNPEDNHNLTGRLFYSVSTCICVPVSLAQNGPALGAQAGEARMKGVATEGGFTRFRRAAETPFNLVFEAKP